MHGSVSASGCKSPGRLGGTGNRCPYRDKKVLEPLETIFAERRISNFWGLVTAEKKFFRNLLA